MYTSMKYKKYNIDANLDASNDIIYLYLIGYYHLSVFGLLHLVHIS